MDEDLDGDSCFQHEYQREKMILTELKVIMADE